MEIDGFGTTIWVVNGEYHREDGPAIETAEGSKFWWVNGELHREDGPAVVLDDGSKFWWLNGIQYTKEEYRLLTFFGVKDV